MTEDTRETQSQIKSLRNAGKESMRDIKFRAWDKINKGWLNISSLSIAKDGSIIGVWELKEGENELYGLHQVELTQYTGLKDKFGKEIYEGDIIKDDSADPNNNIWPVCVNEETGSWCDKPKYANHILYRELESCFEVIGNIWENPDLIK